MHHKISVLEIILFILNIEEQNIHSKGKCERENNKL
jgi:hypothetical protein